jgi:RHS repeat-associated protein
MLIPVSFGPFRKFTGKERDAETGLDYFGARYLSAAEGRFTSPDPLMASATVSNPQKWNRYNYALNNPLRFVDPDGLEVPDDCVKDSNCQIQITLNVIYNKGANHGHGLTRDQKRGFEKEQLEKAKKDYANSNIILKVKYSEGEFDTSSKSVKGIDPNAINIVVMGRTPNGAIGATTVDKEGGTPVVFIDANYANVSNTIFTANTTEHELAHIFLGDVYKERTLVGNLAADIRNDIRLWGQSLLGGISQQDMRDGVGARRYAVPVHPEANKPRKE